MAKYFVNDRNLGLYGVQNYKNSNDDIVYWLNVVCKLTSDRDELLYERKTVNGNGTIIYGPAVYTKVKDGFDTINEGTTLYRKSGTAYVEYDSTKALKLKMLQDYTLGSEEIISYTTARDLTFTTAENDINPAMSKNGDVYIYMPSETTPEDSERLTKATLIRNQNINSMFTVNTPSNSFSVNDLFFDGGNTNMMTAENVNGGAFCITNVTAASFSGVTIKNMNATGKGGALYIANGTVSMVDRTSINDCKASQGGAIYVKENAVLNMKATVTGSGSDTPYSVTITGNKATESGAGIYLERNSKLNLSGKPNFGGEDIYSGTEVDEDHPLGTIKGLSGNFLENEENSLPEAATNGGKAYTKARQDIYIAGYEGNDGDTSAASLTLSGNIASGKGTIWVWAAESPHHKALQQFAVIEDGVTVTEETCNVFRNARIDNDSENTTGDYLYGTLGDTATQYVYWNGAKGLRRVIIRKVNEAHNSVPGATFTIYRKGSSSPVKIKHDDGSEEELKDLVSQSNGVIWVGDLPNGTYYMRETIPSGYQHTTNGDSYNWFILTVNEDGVGYLKTDKTIQQDINPEANKPN
jgi:hypothetical protein